MFRRRSDPMPSKFIRLAVYNTEVARGMVHTPEWHQRMVELQSEFNAWSAAKTAAAEAERVREDAKETSQ